MGLSFQSFNFMLKYETGKVVEIQNKKVGIACRLIQLSIIVYIIGYVIVYEKGYQSTDKAIVSTTTKVKGTTFVNFGKFNSTLFNGVRIYDPEDYIIPPQDGKSVFVMTNMVITPRQHQTECPENHFDFVKEICTSDNECSKGEPIKHGHGIRTGRCVQSDKKPSLKVCEIHGWCPTENDFLPMPGYNFSKSIPLLDGTKESTLLIKNQINFPKFGIGRNNIIRGQDKSYMRRCLHNSETDPLCPIFKLKDIVAACGDNYTQVAFKGAVYGIIIHWDCNLDKDIEDCQPEYKFRRLDDPNTPISKGYNFRFTQYFVENGIRYRTLTKAFGIRFELIVFGKAGKFNIIPLLLNLGAGIGLLGIATFWCDFILLHLVKKRDVYREHICESIGKNKLEEKSNKEIQIVMEPPHMRNKGYREEHDKNGLFDHASPVALV